MLAQGHRLKMGSGLVGAVAEQGEARIASDVRTDAAPLENSHLAGTRSEIALPLRARDQIVGVLDLQSKELAAFGAEDIAMLQILADQVAIAINNAQLFHQVEVSFEAEMQARGEVRHSAWEALLQARSDLGFVGNQRGISPAGDLWRPEMETALQTAQTAFGDDGRATLAMPVRVGGHVIGVLEGRKPQDAGGWTPDEMAMLESLTEQLSAAVDRARLYEDTQRRTAEERLMGEITARMRETLDVDTVLQTAIQEMGTALGLSRIEVWMGETQVSEAEGGEHVAED
jgi:GAF domain-containing protein